MTNVTSKQNKARGKNDERAVAALLGAERHPADTGGPEDLSHIWMSIQCKGGLRVANETIRVGVELAQAAATGTKKLPVLVLTDRSGTRLKRYAVVELEDFCTFFHLPGRRKDGPEREDEFGPAGGRLPTPPPSGSNHGAGAGEAARKAAVQPVRKRGRSTGANE